jgi:serine/threonine-protein kinase
MVSSDLGACEWFVWDLRRSSLIDRGQLDQIVGEFLKRTPRAEPPQLAEFLVSQKVLSPYQAQRVLEGKTQGLVLGPYVLVDTIGTGSMGQVYKAQSKTDNQWYAVKVLPRRSMWNVRLARRQVRSFGAFSQQAVVPFVDVGTSGGLHYLVWPLVDGETLESKVEREGKLPPNQAAALGQQVAAGLAAAHQNGIFHGLIKPSNIMVGPDGQAKILDFGIGSLLVENEGESLVDTMSTANTLTSGLDCASPESIMEPTARTPAGDQYSLGCVLYYCLAGRVPFPEGTAVEKMMAHQFKQPQPLREIVANVPEKLNAVVERLMQKTAEGRYQGIDEVVEELAGAVDAGAKRGFGTRPASGSAAGFSAHPQASAPVADPEPAFRSALSTDPAVHSAPSAPAFPSAGAASTAFPSGTGFGPPAGGFGPSGGGFGPATGAFASASPSMQPMPSAFPSQAGSNAFMPAPAPPTPGPAAQPVRGRPADAPQPDGAVGHGPADRRPRAREAGEALVAGAAVPDRRRYGVHRLGRVGAGQEVLVELSRG